MKSKLILRKTGEDLHHEIEYVDDLFGYQWDVHWGGACILSMTMNEEIYQKRHAEYIGKGWVVESD